MAFYGMARFASRFARRAVRTMVRRPKTFRPRRPRMMRKKTQNKIHSFVRWCDKDTTYGVTGLNSIVETGSNQNLTYQFKLDNVVNPLDFTNLYDSYKINKITLFLEPTSNQTINYSQGIQRKVCVVHDYNDANNLTQEDDYLEYSNCRRYSPLRQIKITLYPKLNNAIENVGGSVNAFTSMNANRVWLNINDDEVPHFGLKVFIPAGITTVGDPPIQTFRVRAKYHISLKNSK